MFAGPACIALFLCAFHSASGQPTPPKSPFSNFIATGSRGRIFFQSDKAPIANILGKESSFINCTLTVTNHFENVERHIRHVSSKPSDNQTSLEICNSVNAGWSRAVNAVSRSNGWITPLSRCTSDVIGVPSDAPPSQQLKRASIPSLLPSANRIETKSQQLRLANRQTRSRSPSASQVQDALQARVEVASNLSTLKQIRENLVSNWSYLEFRGNDSTTRQTVQCYLHFAVGFRIDDLWHLSISYLNHPQAHWVRDGDRLVVTEYVRVDANSNKLISTNLSLPINPVNGTDHVYVTNATTRLVIRAGSSSTSAFMRQTVEESEAFREAFELSQYTVHHAEDALLWSNLAIISLPLILNLMPVSLVTRITSWRMVFYIIISDLIGAIPMLIKGIEILVISKQSFTSMFTRMSDINQSIVTAETWTSQCFPRENFGRSGTLLICIAVSTSFLGIVIELVVNFLARNKYEHLLLSPSPPAELREETLDDSFMNDVELEYM